MLVSGGLGESEIGGPSMNIVPRSGGNTFSRAGVLQHRRQVVDRRQPRRRAARGRHREKRRHHQRVGCAAGRSAARSSATGCGSSAATGSIQPPRPARGTCASTPYAGDSSHWDYLPDDSSVEPRSVQGRDIWSARVDRRRSPTKNRVTFSQEQQYRCEGSTLTTARRGLPQRASRLGRAGLEYPVSGSQHRVFRLAVLGDAGDLVESVDQPAAARSRLFPVRLQRPTADRASCLAGRHLRPDPGDRAVGDRRPQRQLRLPRREHLSAYNYVNAEHLARLRSLRDRHPQREGRLPGAIHDRPTTCYGRNSTLLAYRFHNRVPNQFTFRLPKWETADRTIRRRRFYAQDTWTRNRLSVQGALRYDQASELQSGRRQRHDRAPRASTPRRSRSSGRRA